jgi:hypothetical protein
MVPRFAEASPVAKLVVASEVTKFMVAVWPDLRAPVAVELMVAVGFT